ncbi:MAG: ATPase [Magnetospirillum sp.]|nr:ATPase [Magnetospirillum sp.]
MLSKTIKRFYKQAAAAASETGFAIQLDGKPVKTPGLRPLMVPFQPLAAAIADEWQAQGEQLAPTTMPLTQLASTALDRVGPERAHITTQLLAYAGTDLLCYRVAHPSDLVARQTQAWQPLLDWAALTLNAPLAVTASLEAVEQSPHSLAALSHAIESLDLWRLTALQSATAIMGSLILGLALTQGRIDAAQAFDLSQLDETYQIEQWGEDWEAADRRAEIRRDIDAAEKFLALLA